MNHDQLRPCEYCGAELPEGVDKRTRRTRSAHFAVHAAERREEETRAASKPEQQAQAGEPEVVAWAMERADGLVLDVICPDEHEAHEGDYTIPLITLQANREAMAKKEHELNLLGSATDKLRLQLKEEISGYRQAIAQRDAALDACVEALEFEAGGWEYPPQITIDAITKAQECRK